MNKDLAIPPLNLSKEDYQNICETLRENLIQLWERISHQGVPTKKI